VTYYDQKFDQGKSQPRLMEVELRLALDDVQAVLDYGARKYSPGGWRTVPDAQQRYLDAAFRHLRAYCRGEMRDVESGIEHLAHAAVNLLFIHELHRRLPSVHQAGEPAGPA
jgi:hypothetical protein